MRSAWRGYTAVKNTAQASAAASSRTIPFQHPRAPPLQPDEVVEQALDALDAIPGESAVHQPRAAAAASSPSGGASLRSARSSPFKPICSRIQFSRNGLAVVHRSRSGSSWRPSPRYEERLLQHDKRGWIWTVEAARGLEQAHERPSEGDFLQRPVEERLAHGANRASELVHSRIGRHLSPLEVRPPRHAGVIAPEETEEVLRADTACRPR